MKYLKPKFRAVAVALATLGIIVPQTAYAGGHSHSSSHSSGGSSSHNQPRGHQPPSTGVIPAPNGNTGINGTGLPKPLDACKAGSKDSHDASNVSLGGGVVLSKNVKPAPNGNTGVTGIGVPQNQAKTARSFASSNAGRLGIFSSMARGASVESTNTADINAAKSARLNVGQVGGHQNDFPAGLSSSSPLLRTPDKTSLGIFGNKNASANDNPSAADHPKSQKNAGGDSILKGSGAERITKIEAQAPYRSNVGTPNYSPAKVEVGPSTSPIKPLVDQEVKVGPKLPGEAGVLGKRALNSAADSAAKVEPNVRTTHTTGFDLGPLDPTGGIINAGLEAGQAWLAGSGGGAAASDGGAAAGGDVLQGVIADGSGGGGGSFFSNAVAKATAAAANAAGAAQTAASATTGTGLLLAGAGGVPALGLLAVGNRDLGASIGDYEASRVGYGSLGSPGSRNRPGGAYKGDSKPKSVDGPIAKNKQALSDGSSLSDGGSKSGAVKVAAAASPAAQANQGAVQNKIGTVASDAARLGQFADKPETVPNSTLPAGPIGDARTNSTSSAANSSRGSRFGSMLQNLAGAAGGSDVPASGGSSEGGAAAATSPTPEVASPPAATAGPTAPRVSEGADLVLENVELAAQATLVAGPAYRVKFRNQGTQAAGKFEVAVLAGLDGKLTADAPRAVVEVNSLAAGQSGEVTLRLPQSALQMTGATNGKPAVFTHLFVAVDLMNTVVETDETNNTAVIERVIVDAVAAE